MPPEALPQRLPYGEGVFRRRFRLEGDEGRVRADMEDDFHRFRVALRHDGRRVLELRGESLRYPWSECPGASRPLRELEGLRLTPRATAVAEATDPRIQCTHLLDLAALAVTHAFAGRPRRGYDIEIPDRVAGRTRARLRRDGRPLLDWEVEHSHLLGPEPFAGVGLRGRQFLRWVDERFDPETAEAVLALRRACFISIGRLRDLDEAPDASVYLPLAGSSCHAFTPGIAERARRMRGTSWEFTRHPERLLADVAP